MLHSDYYWCCFLHVLSYQQIVWILKVKYEIKIFCASASAEYFKWQSGWQLLSENLIPFYIFYPLWLYKWLYLQSCFSTDKSSLGSIICWTFKINIDKRIFIPYFLHLLVLILGKFLMLLTLHFPYQVFSPPIIKNLFSQSFSTDSFLITVQLYSKQTENVFFFIG